MWTIIIYDVNKNVIGEYKMNKSDGMEKILIHMKIKGPIYYKNSLYTKTEKWTLLKNNELLRQEIYLAKKSVGIHVINVMVLYTLDIEKQKKTPCDDKIFQLVYKLNDIDLEYCIIDILECWKYAHKLFCEDEYDSKNINYMTKTELYFFYMYVYVWLSPKKSIGDKIKSIRNRHLTENDRFIFLEYLRKIKNLIKNEYDNHRIILLNGLVESEITKNHTVAEEYLMNGIRQGDLYGAYNALLSLYTHDIKKRCKMLRFLKYGYRRNIFAAINNLGVYYALKMRDEENSLNYLIKAKKKGSIIALYNIGHAVNLILQHDHISMVENWKRAADYSIPEALLALANYNFYVINNHIKGKYLCEHAMQKYNFPPAYSRWFKFHLEEGLQAVGAPVLFDGIARGYGNCIYEVGVLYSQNENLSSKGINYLKLAKAMGFKDASLHIGHAYRHRKDTDAMVTAYEECIHESPVDASSAIYHIYKYIKENTVNENGMHTKCFEMAVMNIGGYLNKYLTHNNACFYMAMLYQSEKKYDEMIRYYEMAIKERNVMAMYNLAMYYKNNGSDKCIQYFIMARHNFCRRSFMDIIKFKFYDVVDILLGIPHYKNIKVDHLRVLSERYSLDYSRLSLALKLLSCSQNDHYMCLFYLYYYILNNADTAMKFLKIMCVLKCQSPLIYSEYIDYHINTFRNQLFNTGNLGHTVNFIFKK